MQRRIQNTVKHRKWSFFAKVWLTVGSRSLFSQKRNKKTLHFEWVLNPTLSDSPDLSNLFRK